MEWDSLNLATALRSPSLAEADDFYTLSGKWKRMKRKTGAERGKLKAGTESGNGKLKAETEKLEAGKSRQS